MAHCLQEKKVNTKSKGTSFLSKGILLQLIVPIVVIVSICITFYMIKVKPSSDYTNMLNQQVEKRIEAVEKYTNRIYQHEVEAVRSEKTLFYIIMLGTSGILLVVFFNIFRIILRVPIDYLRNPEEFSVVPSMEADALRYVKDKLIEKKIIDMEAKLVKEDVMRLLAYPSSDS